MEVILIKDIDKLGYADDVVNVKPGFARNYLIPNGFAINKNTTNMAILSQKIKIREKKEEALMADIKAIVEKLKNTNVQIGAKVGTTNKIFGSVNAVQISEALKQSNIEIDKRKITIKEGEIKELGSYTAVITLNKDNIVEIPLEIISE